MCYYTLYKSKNKYSPNSTKTQSQISKYLHRPHSVIKQSKYADGTAGIRY